jgi:hypothetical protein
VTGQWQHPIDYWINWEDYSVHSIKPFPNPADGAIIERVPIPRDQVKRIIESGPNPYAALAYWVHQWEVEEDVDAGGSRPF